MGEPEGSDGWAEALAELVRDARTVLEDARLQGAIELPAVPRQESADVPSPSPEPASEKDADAHAAALAEVREVLGDCQRCKLAKSRTNLVFGVGSPHADLVVVGEAPGYHEDQQGEPFVGAAGQMLDKMLENVLGLTRAQAYILNVLKCRPPKNRNPLPDEVEACRPFLERQIDAIAPKVLVVLGSVAFRTLFQTDQGITRARGRWQTYRDIPTMPTFHPAYLLRNPADKRLTFEDLKAARRRYDELGGLRS